MRSVVAISMPDKIKKELQKEAAKAKKTVSAYILDMYAMTKELISEDELLRMRKKARSNYKKGETKKLKSLADLI